MKTALSFGLGVLVFVIGLNGCATIKQGEDALVVRAEQAEAGAKATFDLLLSIDHVDRGFWRTNASGFHAFCEYLRAPQVVNVTNILPRAMAMIVSVDTVKRDYKVSKTYSNSLVSVIAILESANVQAGAWAQLITNKLVK